MSLSGNQLRVYTFISIENYAASVQSQKLSFSTPFRCFFTPSFTSLFVALLVYDTSTLALLSIANN